jgi:hypothetical protein
MATVELRSLMTTKEQQKQHEVASHGYRRTTYLNNNRTTNNKNIRNGVTWLPLHYVPQQQQNNKQQ